ncbi:MAG: glycosyltransferase family 4 protein [Bryobacteraceae bacterium]|jgi:glycosyltransferase involved in cell wall biosynthesis
MRILLLNRFFWPDTAATGQLLYDLAEHLAASGDTVHVICGSANYGGSNNAPRPQAGITRLKKARFLSLVAGRLGSYLSFLAGALWHGVRHRPDLVVTLTDPPLLSLAGLAIQRWRGARHIIWEMDVYPDIAVDLGVFKANGLLAQVFGWLADLPRRHADNVIVLGKCMQSRLLAHGISESKISIAENWADCDAADRNRYTQPPLAEGLSVIYSGNLGRAHDAATIAGAMAELKQTEGFRFVFAGGGSRQAWLREFCEKSGVENAQFLPYCERAELSARLASGHVGLVTQQPASAGSVVPSKTYGILAAGRPVLFIGPRESTTARVIARYGCGWQIDCGDVGGLTALLRCLNDNKELISAASARAHQAFIGHYQRSIGVARVAAILQQVNESKTSALIQPAALAK